MTKISYYDKIVGCDQNVMTRFVDFSFEQDI